MAELRVDGDELIVDLSTRERWGAFHRDLRIPVAAVKSVRPVEEAMREVEGLRAPGTGWPRVIALGTWRRRGVKDFVAAYRQDRGVVIELEGHEFARVIASGDIADEVLALG